MMRASSGPSLSGLRDALVKEDCGTSTVIGSAFKAPPSIWGIRCWCIIRERRIRMDEKRKKLIEEIGELAMYNDMTYRG